MVYQEHSGLKKLELRVIQVYFLKDKRRSFSYSFNIYPIALIFTSLQNLIKSLVTSNTQIILQLILKSSLDGPQHRKFKNDFLGIM